MSHDLNGKASGGNVEVVARVIMLTSRGQALGFSQCRLINRHTEAPLQGRIKKKKRHIIPEPLFSRGIRFLCFSRFSEHDVCVLPRNTEEDRADQGSLMAGRAVVIFELILWEL